MRIFKNQLKWLSEKVAVSYPKAYRSKLPFYMVIKTNEAGVKIEDDGDIWLPDFCFVRKDKNGNTYIVPSEKGDYQIIHESWSGDRGYTYTTYSKTAVLEKVGYSNGGGAGEYWAIIPKEAKNDTTLAELDALANEL